MSLVLALSVALAAGLDALVGEPPNFLHPVAWFGRAVAPLDRAWSTPRLVGAVGAAVLPLAAAGFVCAVLLLASVASVWLAGILAGVTLALTTSLRMLVTSAREVIAASERDPNGAREALPVLAGRDPSDLSPAHLRSAAVESAAENLADGLVAPLAAFCLAATAVAVAGLPIGRPTTVALAAGAAGAAWVKAVNTMDSMLGYRSKPVGWAPARLDDAVMWVPARLAALLLAVAAGRPHALLAARSSLASVPSPNSGWPMATLAAARDCRLEKPGVYAVGSGGLPDAATAERAVRTVLVAGVLAYALAALVVLTVGSGLVPGDWTVSSSLVGVLAWS